jgi:hypothetical protein
MLNGHGFDFSYLSLDDLETCEMLCKCGWRTNIESFDKPWSIIEVGFKAKEHLGVYGVALNDQVAVFKFDTEN